MSIFTGNRHLSRTLCILCLLGVIAPDAALAAAGAPPSNFEILAQVSSEAAHEIIACVGSSGLVRVSKTKGIGDVDFILENEFVKQLKDAGVRVSTKSRTAEGDSASYELSYRIVRFAVSYPKIWRSHWLLSRRVRRSAEIEIFAQLVDQRSGDVTWVGESQKRYVDTIAYSQLPAVEEKQYDFTRPPRSEFKLGKAVEPIIVAGIVTGLVFLFFSNQKND